MRRSFTKLSNPIGNATKQTLLSSSSSAFPYSTSSGGGGGRGRGRGRGSDFFNSKFSPTSPGNSDSPSPPSTLGHGHGRGQPPRSNPSFSFVAPADPRGRGDGPISFTQPGPPPPESILTPYDSISKKPIFLKNEEPVDSVPNPPNLALSSNNSILSEGGPAQGRGRGKPVPLATEKPKEKNRHIRTRPPPELGKEKAIGKRESNTGPKLSKEEAINRARNVLSRDGDGGGGGGRRGSNADEGGRGGRGRGRGRRGRGRGRGRGAMDYSDEDEYEDDEGEDPEALAEEEAFQEGIVKNFDVEKAKLVLETFEVATDDALPSIEKEAYLEAMDVNFMIECEPEYMVEIENPDIDEKPPIPLRDALEKMKPFLMAYEDIRTDEEWEEVVEDAMASVPLMEKIVDAYGGPDRVTAKQQEEELERVAKTLPESAPSSVKQFTDRVVLCLQSNPGWGFDKKFQFMDKLVREVSQRYK